MKQIQARPQDCVTYAKALELGYSQGVANVLSRRSIPVSQLEKVVRPQLKDLPSPFLLKGIDRACERLIIAIQNQELIGILTDYDVDGITSHAVIFQALTEYFALPSVCVESLIGHRLEDGYGVSSSLVDKILANPRLPSLIITADCGSSDEERLKRLKAAGIDVIVTDHHGIGEQGVPASAYVTINPVQPECEYPDKSIAGCMVAWLTMSALRQCLVEQGLLSATAPKLSKLLDYVALGTVADAVSLASPINRAVVKAGLTVMNQSDRAAWQALRVLLAKECDLGVEDLGFQIGPRINARGRLSDPGIALTFLMATDTAVALGVLRNLDEHNQSRKQIERDMLNIAREHALTAMQAKTVSVVSFHQHFHPGVQGIVASRLVEISGRVCAVFSPMGDSGLLSGSVRSIEGVHVRAALAWVSQTYPGLLVSFGGHAGAAGLKIKEQDLSWFQEVFEAAVALQLPQQDLRPLIWTDGPINQPITLEFLAELNQLSPFGRGFAAPVFEDIFRVKAIAPIGKTPVHLSLSLLKHDQVYKAVWFNALAEPEASLPFEEGALVQVAFKIQENVYQGCARLQLLLEWACVAKKSETAKELRMEKVKL